MKNLKKIFVLFFLVISFVACNKEEQTSANNGVLALNAKATYNNAARLQSKSSSTFNITSIFVNLKEIEFEFDDDNQNNDDDASSDFGFDDDLKLNGPFELNLLNSTETIAIANLPNGVYEEIEFKLDKNDNPASALFNKSIEIKGTINNIPFVYWHNQDENFEVDFEDKNTNISIANNAINVSLNFDVNDLLKNVSLTSATDGNGNGTIEIGPNDTDGNNSLANSIKDKIKDFINLE